MTKPLELPMFRRGHSLVPAAAAFDEDLSAIPESQEVMVKVTMPRNPRQDRWYWAMLGEVVKSGAWDGDKDSLHNRLKMALGLVEEIVDPGTPSRVRALVATAIKCLPATAIGAVPGLGAALDALHAAMTEMPETKVYYVLQSISPASMDRLRFQEFIRGVERYMAETLGVDIGALRNETRASAGGDAEPKWEPETPAAVIPPSAGEGEATASLPRTAPASPANSAAEPDPSHPSALVRKFAAALHDQPNTPAMIRLHEAMKRKYPQMAEERFKPLLDRLHTLHLKLRLEDMPRDVFDTGVERILAEFDTCTQR